MKILSVRSLPSNSYMIKLTQALVNVSYVVIKQSGTKRLVNTIDFAIGYIGADGGGGDA